MAKRYYLSLALSSLFVFALAAKVSLDGYHIYKHELQRGKAIVQDTSLLIRSKSASRGAVQVLGMRKFPYPYDAMFAISSDADNETLRKFDLVHEFINTRQKTPFGYYGVGLPFADSVFMYNASNLSSPVDQGHTPHSEQMSWFKGASNQAFEASQINEYIHAGWIDTLHSYGDFSMVNPNETRFTRKLAEQAIQVLQENGDFLTIWTDHGNQSNVDGFGSYGNSKFYDYQQGDNPKSIYYHTDLTIPYGIRFVWPDSNTDVYGRTSMIYPIELRDGQKVWGFWRNTSSGMTSTGMPIWDWTVGDLSQQITLVKLQQLEQAHDYCIIAQHIEALNSKLPLPQNAIGALWTLAHQYNDEKLLVATTSELLNYNVVQQYLQYDVTYENGYAVIHIKNVTDPVDGTYRPTLTELRGVTFYTTNPERTIIEIGNTPIPKSYTVDSPSDGIDPSIGIKWFTWNTTNYALEDNNHPTETRNRTS